MKKKDSLVDLKRGDLILAPKLDKNLLLIPNRRFFNQLVISFDNERSLKVYAWYQEGPSHFLERDFWTSLMFVR